LFKRVKRGTPITFQEHNGVKEDIMKPFEYFEPLTIEETLSLLNKYQNEAKILAGGTDLVHMMRERIVSPKYVINIGRLNPLNYIRSDAKGGICIGALTPIRDIEQSPQLQPRYIMVSQAARQLASIPIRNVATIGGNLCNASPSADMPPILIALSAVTKLISVRGERTVPLEQLLTGPGATVLKADELLAEIQIPPLPTHTSGTYLKYSTRGGQDITFVGVATVLTLNVSDETCTDAKIVLGAVAPTPIRAHNAETVLKGKRVNGDLIREAAQIASGESRPVDDIRGAAEYRREMLKVLVRDAIVQAAELAKAAM
jgi:CO/xanthine dehydrogenase FAD-binding subunit